MWPDCSAAVLQLLQWQPLLLLLAAVAPARPAGARLTIYHLFHVIMRLIRSYVSDTTQRWAVWDMASDNDNDSRTTAVLASVTSFRHNRHTRNTDFHQCCAGEALTAIHVHGLIVII